MKIGYLGPKGTFTEQGALFYSKEEVDCELVGFSAIADVIAAVESGEITEGVVPFENSIEGTVTTSIDALIFDVSLYIKREFVIPISENLFMKPEFAAVSPEKILSHPQGIAQCRRYLRKTFPNVPIETVASTAASAKIVSEADRPMAGIGAKRAAELYGLTVVGNNIQDEDKNYTRFIVVTRQKPEIGKENKKASIVFSTENKPGGLCRLLDIFFHFDLNMTKIESRPMKKEGGNWEYVFFVDLETENCQDIIDALTMVKRRTPFFKYLGAYPLNGRKDGGS